MLTQRLLLRAAIVAIMGATGLSSPPTARASTPFACLICVVGETCQSIHPYSICLALCGDWGNVATCTSGGAEIYCGTANAAVVDCWNLVQ